MSYRTLTLKCLLAIIVWPLANTVAAPTCDCFSAEQRAKTARDGLANARLVLLGRVVAVAPDGSARLRIIESFKGGTKPEVAVQEPELQIPRQSAECTPNEVKDRRFSVGEELLVLSFNASLSLCDTYASDHYLVQEFRLLLPK
jgi:hypothetical protein